MDANRHIRLTTLRYQMDRSEMEQFRTQKNKGYTVSNHIRF